MCKLPFVREQVARFLLFGTLDLSRLNIFPQTSLGTADLSAERFCS